MNIIAKRLRKKVANEWHGVEEVITYYLSDSDTDEFDESNSYNEEQLEEYYNSLSSKKQKEILNAFDIKSYDEYSMQTILEKLYSNNSNIANEIKEQVNLEEIYAYNSNETFNDVQNCACLYSTEEAAEEAANAYNDEYDDKQYNNNEQINLGYDEVIEQLKKNGIKQIDSKLFFENDSYKVEIPITKDNLNDIIYCTLESKRGYFKGIIKTTVNELLYNISNFILNCDNLSYKL